MKNIKFKDIINDLISFAPRQLEGEKKALDYLKNKLTKEKIGFTIQKFFTWIPQTQKAFLKADGKEIKCEGCGFWGGKIETKENLLSSLFSSSVAQEISNINFNIYCSGISLKNYYFAPALAISIKDINKIIKAKKVQGELKVKKIKHQSANLLVGNLSNPKHIVFSHYDSIKKGAIDNASGVALLLKMVLERSVVLKSNLFVFSGSEELSYDKPIYWGKGFRVFEEKYQKITKRTQKIIVVDCLGNAQPQLISDLALAKLAFPVKNLEKIGKKVKILTADINELMKVYHSDLDDGRNIKEKYLEEAYKLLSKEIN